MSATVKAEVGWIKQHEKLIALALLALTFYGTVDKIETVMLDHAQTKAALTKQIADDEADANKQVEQAVSALKASYDRTIADLNRQIAERDSALSKQQQQNKQATPDELAARWRTLINGGASDITVSGGSYTVSPSGAVTTVNQLEEVPVLTKDLSDTKQELSKSQDVVNGLNNQVTGLQTQIKDDNKQCQAQITDIKNKARVSKLKWFGVGFVTGFVAAVGAIVR